MDAMTPWETWKKAFYSWEGQTAKYLEEVLQSPAVLRPSGKLLGSMMKLKAKRSERMANFWSSMGLPTRHDQERMMHAVNQLQSRIYDLEEQLLEARQLIEEQ